MEYATLQNGLKMPMLGYGTIGQAGEQIADNVAFALNHGYELIDTANRYGNEVEVGQGLKKSGLKREEYFLETKLGPTLYENDGAIDGTLRRLDVDYIDLMLLHHPVNNYIYAYHMLEKAYKEGKLRAIGVSNFPVEKLEELLQSCEIPPMVMQVEAHPYYPQTRLKAYLAKYQMVLMAWYPLGHGDKSLVNEEVFTKLGQKYGKSNAQIILRWHVQSGNVIIPGSKNAEHIKDNFNIFDFRLTDEEMKQIAQVNKNTRYYNISLEDAAKAYMAKQIDFNDQK